MARIPARSYYLLVFAKLLDASRQKSLFGMFCDAPTAFFLQMLIQETVRIKSDSTNEFSVI